MKSLGLSDSEIAEFKDPYRWLCYFPPLAKEDLKAFGMGCDWRRSFITTDMNPFHDNFFRWQMRNLYCMGKILKYMRYTVFSPLDGQPCADHDRASGEGVQPQDYVLIKMEVIPPFPEKLKALEGQKILLAAAILRPETTLGKQIVGYCLLGNMVLLKFMKLMFSFLLKGLLSIFHIRDYRGFPRSQLAC
ncbi:leucyl-tRNA synthetase [Apostasia shenzhenica]|uniref:Leucyl-tRNA synthetase n=1 Tax=Apostasia shenzhenica TaxID=1088818 RepID=A0A2I0ATB7_9ASPA|nr:leucyl-tRNA synthetase [Apostasia shenzhenica]